MMLWRAGVGMTELRVDWNCIRRLSQMSLKKYVACVRAVHVPDPDTPVSMLAYNRANAKT